jgi:hypothetical protein
MELACDVEHVTCLIYTPVPASVLFALLSFYPTHGVHSGLNGCGLPSTPHVGSTPWMGRVAQLKLK